MTMLKNKNIFEQSSSGRKGASLPECDVAEKDLSDNIPSDLLRTKYANLPEVSEPQVVRHYINLSNKNHHVDKDFYPLGSCTMKYNPKINDAIAALPDFSNVHPRQPVEMIQGSLHILYELEKMLCKITGMDSITLQPNAGSQGELLGIMLMSKFHQLNGEKRKYVLIPDTAHGTNFSSIVIGGYETHIIKSDIRGRVDLKDLKSKLNKDVAGFMLTQPNTLGLFEDKIEEISKAIHGEGGLMYMDGANLNALVGLCQPAKMGFDIVHINLHKTFSTPHGGGGPGSGPIGVTKKLANFLPIPRICRKSNGEYYFDNNENNSVGQIHSFYGNFAILLRAYVYILSLGDKGLKNMSRNAIINANYLKNHLSKYFDIPFSEGSLHEFVASGVKQKSKGVKVLDIAKSLLDYGFHAPTIYFPSNVPESMMIEPTESETKETLDRFIEAMNEINELINIDPDRIRNAPYDTPVKRLDETKANRELDLRWK